MKNKLNNQDEDVKLTPQKHNENALKMLEEISKRPSRYKTPFTHEQMLKQQEMMNNSSRKEMVNHIVKYLKAHESELDKYNWVVKIEGLSKLITISEEDLNYLNSKDKSISSFEKTVRLKEILTPLLNDSYKNNQTLFNKISLWLVKEWGGIKSGKDDNLIILIQEAISSVQNNELISYERISSKSKILEFMFPKTNIIYDSRIAYTLNWILLIKFYREHKYFPIPEGKGPKRIAFDMSTLIRVKNIRIFLGNLQHRHNVSNGDKLFFVSENEAYKKMNDLVCEINKLLWDSLPERKEEPFYTQMLLFTLADNVIFKEMKSKIRLNISDSVD